MALIYLFTLVNFKVVYLLIQTFKSYKLTNIYTCEPLTRGVNLHHGFFVFSHYVCMAAHSLELEEAARALGTRSSINILWFSDCTTIVALDFPAFAPFI